MLRQIRSLHGYLVEWMLKAAWEKKVIARTTESLEKCKQRLYETKVRYWKDKPLHGAFVWDIEETAVE